ncbi:hypothetical protein BMS3Abin03_01525 [bacterium BMS3Abin03]|nr:hypothetical protein BMS3Abin03_01525 [bacterium BMS3Abin03]
MKLPRKISPDPLLSTVVELRLTFNLKREEILNYFYPLLKDKYPKFEFIGLPTELKDKGNIQYKPDFQFKNEQFALSLSNDVLVFENIGEYPLWENYFKSIKDDLAIIGKGDFVVSIKRIGLRYISIFQNKLSLTDLCNINLDIKEPENYIQKDRVLHSTFTKNNVKLFLRIYENASAQKLNKSFNGLLIDIDASQADNIPQNFDESLFTIIDKLHKEEKILFYRLLKEDFINSLKPEY